MPIRTGVSEDPKGDPTKVIPNQPEPGVPTEEIEPLLPPPDPQDAAPAAPGKAARTPADRRGIDGKQQK